METCRIEGCDRPVYVKKRMLCAPHYSSLHKRGELDGLPPTICDVADCDNRAVARGYCNAHYKRLKRRGVVTKRTLEERFWKYVSKGEDAECWPWTGGGLHSWGYGLIRGGNDSHYQAHRVAYELLVGPIPEGLQIDHLCRNRACVNPAHLEPVTQRENILRSENMAARWARREVCHVCGGPFTQEKTVRVCRACRKRRVQAWKAKRQSV